MSDLDKRLSHFEANQTALNDMYGAELIHNTRKHITELEQENQRLREALTELYAQVKGECPSLLNEDSGGDAELDYKIEQLLAQNKE